MNATTACALLDCIRFARCSSPFPRIPVLRPEMAAATREQTAACPAFPAMSFDLHRFEHHRIAVQPLHPIAVGCPQTICPQTMQPACPPYIFTPGSVRARQNSTHR